MADRGYFVHNINIKYSPSNDSKPIIEDGDEVRVTLSYKIYAITEVTLGCNLQIIHEYKEDAGDGTYIGNIVPSTPKNASCYGINLTANETREFTEDIGTYTITAINGEPTNIIEVKLYDVDGTLFKNSIFFNKLRSVASYDNVGNSYYIQTSANNVIRNDKSIMDDIPYKFVEISAEDGFDHIYYLNGAIDQKVYSPQSDTFLAIFECNKDTYQNDNMTFRFGLNSIANCNFFDRKPGEDRGSLVFSKGNMAFVIIKNRQFVYPISGSASGESTVVNETFKKISSFRIYKSSNGTGISNIKSFFINGLMSPDVDNIYAKKAIFSELIPSDYNGGDIVEDGTLVYDSTNQCLVFRNANGPYDYYDCVDGSYYLRTMLDPDGNIVKRDTDLVVPLSKILFKTIIPESFSFDNLLICYGQDDTVDGQMSCVIMSDSYQIGDSVVLPGVNISY